MEPNQKEAGLIPVVNKYEKSADFMFSITESTEVGKPFSVIKNKFNTKGEIISQRKLSKHSSAT